jgi:hypothetical protein
MLSLDVFYLRLQTAASLKNTAKLEYQDKKNYVV